jgi:Ca2+:H+ antiporter
MFVAPVLVLVSFFFKTQMPLIFSWPELIAMASSVLLMVVISNDGESNWFEGLTLIAAYFIMGLGFFLL